MECFDRVYRVPTYIGISLPPPKKENKKKKYACSSVRGCTWNVRFFFFLYMCSCITVFDISIAWTDFYGCFNQDKNSLWITRQSQHLSSIPARRFLSSGFTHSDFYLEADWRNYRLCCTRRSQSRQNALSGRGSARCARWIVVSQTMRYWSVGAFTRTMCYYISMRPNLRNGTA